MSHWIITKLPWGFSLVFFLNVAYLSILRAWLFLLSGIKCSQRRKCCMICSPPQEWITTCNSWKYEWSLTLLDKCTYLGFADNATQPVFTATALSRKRNVKGFSETWVQQCHRKITTSFTQNDECKEITKTHWRKRETMKSHVPMQKTFSRRDIHLLKTRTETQFIGPGIGPLGNSVLQDSQSSYSILANISLLLVWVWSCPTCTTTAWHTMLRK